MLAQSCPPCNQQAVPLLLLRGSSWGQKTWPSCAAQVGEDPACPLIHTWWEHQKIFQTWPESTALLARTPTSLHRYNNREEHALGLKKPASAATAPLKNLQVHCAQSTVPPPAQPPLGPPGAGQPLNPMVRPKPRTGPSRPHPPDSPSTFMIWYVSWTTLYLGSFRKACAQA